MSTTHKTDGYRGIWYTLGQFAEYGDKYSGGLGTYTANHTPMAVYAEAVNRTYFVYGGAPAADQRYLLCMVGCYDHARHQVQRPTIVCDKGIDGVDDPHDNPSLQIDDAGYLWVFVSGRNVKRPGIIYRSVKPHDIDGFEEVHIYPGMTYPQPWISDAGFLFMFTKYTAGRELYFAQSSDGKTWTDTVKLAGLGGHYQVSSYHREGHKLATFFNHHPGGDVNLRTNLYYLQSVDGGATWQTAAGDPVAVPLADIPNPALVIDYAAEGTLQYTCDFAWDTSGNPLLLYVTSRNSKAGPEGQPRAVRLTRWTGERWITTVVASTWHNYDLGSLHVTDDRWTILFPTGEGPQTWGTGGEIELWESTDQGASWTKVRAVTAKSERNHAYVRRPEHFRDPFAAFWADGNPDELSPSVLHFCDRAGATVYRLPYTMDADWQAPEEVISSS